VQPVSDTLEVEVVPVTPFAQNCSILRSRASDGGVVIDPGGDVPRLLAALERNGTRVEAVLLTHGHVDHAGGAAELARTLQVPVLGPQREERFWLDQLARQAELFGPGPAEDVGPERWVADGERLTVAGLELEVLHCPGHTPGHVVYFHRPSRFAVVGDVLFQGSIGRTDFPRGDYDTLIRSIREKLLVLGDDVLFLPGHGPTSILGEERRRNPFLVAPERYRP
jgi:glyoxylase-like metal-dependent hydrolase (beta-lactamase superfamily II)